VRAGVGRMVVVVIWVGEGTRNNRINADQCDYRDACEHVFVLRGILKC
jgi:hypothetical protein